MDAVPAEQVTAGSGCGVHTLTVAEDALVLFRLLLSSFLIIRLFRVFLWIRLPAVSFLLLGQCPLIDLPRLICSLYHFVKEHKPLYNHHEHDDPARPEIADLVLALLATLVLVDYTHEALGQVIISAPDEKEGEMELAEVFN